MEMENAVIIGSSYESKKSIKIHRIMQVIEF